jgi:hypothetical protein
VLINCADRFTLGIVEFKGICLFFSPDSFLRALHFLLKTPKGRRWLASLANRLDSLVFGLFGINKSYLAIFKDSLTDPIQGDVSFLLIVN